jgi:hypothetical protein
MAEIFAAFSKYNVPIDRLSFAFSGMIDKVEQMVQKGQFANLNEGYNSILKTIRDLMDTNQDAARRIADDWFGAKGGGVILDGLRHNIMYTAEEMKKFSETGVDPKYNHSLEQGVRMTASFTAELGILQRQMESSFRSVGTSVNEILGGMSRNMGTWIQTHQGEVITWAYHVSESAATMFAKVINGFASVLDAMKTPLNAVKDI